MNMISNLFIFIISDKSIINRYTKRKCCPSISFYLVQKTTYNVILA